MGEFKRKYNSKVEKSLQQTFRLYQQAGSLETFEKYFRIGDILLMETEDGDFSFNQPFQIS